MKAILNFEQTIVLLWALCVVLIDLVAIRISMSANQGAVLLGPQPEHSEQKEK